jgi:hypothetical protein
MLEMPPIHESAPAGGFNNTSLTGRSDEECIAIFDDLRDDLEFVFRNLQMEGSKRVKVAERVESPMSKKL